MYINEICRHKLIINKFEPFILIYFNRDKNLGIVRKPPLTGLTIWPSTWLLSILLETFDLASAFTSEFWFLSPGLINECLPRFFAEDEPLLNSDTSDSFSSSFDGVLSDSKLFLGLIWDSVISDDLCGDSIGGFLSIISLSFSLALPANGRIDFCWIGSLAGVFWTWTLQNSI